jgi:predicted MarR family transcription regulator
VNKIFSVLNRGKKRPRSLSELLEATGFDIGPARYALKKAIAEGLVKQNGIGKFTTYEVVP